ncbi:MAG: hypothetical protein ACOVO1_09530 [Chitinophagaceae bacterium]
MKTINFKCMVVALMCSLVTISCKKTSNNDVIVEEATQARVQTDDAAMVDGETESADDDVNNVTAASERFCGPGNVFGSPFNLADATITTSAPGTASKITIVYNGNTNPNSPCRKRTGTIIIDLLNAPKWVDPGATLKYTFINFKVENTCTNRSVTINGERFVTNVKGGNLFRLRNNLVDSLQHKIKTGSVGLEATFTDSSGTKTAVWNVARNTIIKNIGTTYFFTSMGDTTIGNSINTESWGTTRFGSAYKTVFSSAVKANTNCKLWKPTAGEVVHYVGNFTSTVKLGLNALGNPVGLNDCAGYFRVTWMLSNGTNSSSLVPYK